MWIPSSLVCDSPAPASVSLGVIPGDSSESEHGAWEVFLRGSETL